MTLSRRSLAGFLAASLLLDPSFSSELQPGISQAPAPQTHHFDEQAFVASLTQFLSQFARQPGVKTRTMAMIEGTRAAQRIAGFHRIWSWAKQDPRRASWAEGAMKSMQRIAREEVPQQDDEKLNYTTPLIEGIWEAVRVLKLNPFHMAPDEFVTRIKDYLIANHFPLLAEKFAQRHRRVFDDGFRDATLLDRENLISVFEKLAEAGILGFREGLLLQTSERSLTRMAQTIVANITEHTRKAIYTAHGEHDAATLVALLAKPSASSSPIKDLVYRITYMDDSKLSEIIELRHQDPIARKKAMAQFVAWIISKEPLRLRLLNELQKRAAAKLQRSLAEAERMDKQKAAEQRAKLKLELELRADLLAKQAIRHGRKRFELALKENARAGKAIQQNKIIEDAPLVVLNAVKDFGFSIPFVFARAGLPLFVKRFFTRGPRRQIRYKDDRRMTLENIVLLLVALQDLVGDHANSAALAKNKLSKFQEQFRQAQEETVRLLEERDQLLFRAVEAGLKIVPSLKALSTEVGFDPQWLSMVFRARSDGSVIFTGKPRLSLTAERKLLKSLGQISRARLQMDLQVSEMNHVIIEQFVETPSGPEEEQDLRTALLKMMQQAVNTGAFLKDIASRAQTEPPRVNYVITGFQGERLKYERGRRLEPDLSIRLIRAMDQIATERLTRSQAAANQIQDLETHLRWLHHQLRRQKQTSENTVLSAVSAVASVPVPLEVIAKGVHWSKSKMKQIFRGGRGEPVSYRGERRALSRAAHRLLVDLPKMPVLSTQRAQEAVHKTAEHLLDTQTSLKNSEERAASAFRTAVERMIERGWVNSEELTAAGVSVLGLPALLKTSHSFEEMTRIFTALRKVSKQRSPRTTRAELIRRYKRMTLEGRHGEPLFKQIAEMTEINVNSIRLAFSDQHHSMAPAKLNLILSALVQLQGQPVLEISDSGQEFVSEEKDDAQEGTEIAKPDPQRSESDTRRRSETLDRAWELYYEQDWDAVVHELIGMSDPRAEALHTLTQLRILGRTRIPEEKVWPALNGFSEWLTPIAKGTPFHQNARHWLTLMADFVEAHHDELIALAQTEPYQAREYFAWLRHLENVSEGVKQIHDAEKFLRAREMLPHTSGSASPIAPKGPRHERHRAAPPQRTIFTEMPAQRRHLPQHRPPEWLKDEAVLIQDLSEIFGFSEDSIRRELDPLRKSTSYAEWLSEIPIHALSSKRTIGSLMNLVDRIPSNNDVKRVFLHTLSRHFMQDFHARPGRIAGMASELVFLVDLLGGPLNFLGTQPEGTLWVYIEAGLLRTLHKSPLPPYDRIQSLARQEAVRLIADDFGLPITFLSIWQLLRFATLDERVRNLSGAARRDLLIWMEEHLPKTVREVRKALHLYLGLGYTTRLASTAQEENTERLVTSHVLPPWVITPLPPAQIPHHLLSVQKGRAAQQHEADTYHSLYRLAKSVIQNDKELNRLVAEELLHWVINANDLDALAYILAGWHGRPENVLASTLQTKWRIPHSATRSLVRLGAASEYTPAPITWVSEPAAPYEDQLAKNNIYAQLHPQRIEMYAERAASVDTTVLKNWLTQVLHEQTGGQGRVLSIILYGGFLYGHRRRPNDLDVIAIVEAPLTKRWKSPVQIPESTFLTEHKPTNPEADVSMVTFEHIQASGHLATQIANVGIALRGEDLLGLPVQESSAESSLTWAQNLLTEGKELAGRRVKQTERFPHAMTIWWGKSVRRMTEANTLIWSIDPSAAVPYEDIDGIVRRMTHYLEHGGSDDAATGALKSLHARISDALTKARITVVRDELERILKSGHGGAAPDSMKGPRLERHRTVQFDSSGLLRRSVAAANSPINRFEGRYTDAGNPQKRRSRSSVSTRPSELEKHEIARLQLSNSDIETLVALGLSTVPSLRDWLNATTSTGITEIGADNGWDTLETVLLFNRVNNALHLYSRQILTARLSAKKNELQGRWINWNEASDYFKRKGALVWHPKHGMGTVVWYINTLALVQFRDLEEAMRMPLDRTSLEILEESSGASTPATAAKSGPTGERHRMVQFNAIDLFRHSVAVLSPFWRHEARYTNASNPNHSRKTNKLPPPRDVSLTSHEISRLDIFDSVVTLLLKEKVSSIEDLRTWLSRGYSTNLMQLISHHGKTQEEGHKVLRRITQALAAYDRGSKRARDYWLLWERAPVFAHKVGALVRHPVHGLGKVLHFYITKVVVKFDSKPQPVDVKLPEQLFTIKVEIGGAVARKRRLSSSRQLKSAA